MQNCGERAAGRGGDGGAAAAGKKRRCCWEDTAEENPPALGDAPDSGRDPPALGAMAEEPALGVAAARSTASSPEKAAVSSREPCEARLRGAGFGNDAAAGIWG